MVDSPGNPDRARFLPWRKKYTPRTFAEFLDQDAIKDALAVAVVKNQLDNYLFAGPPGQGKTQMAQLFAREYFTFHGAMRAEDRTPPPGAYRLVELTTETANVEGVEELRKFTRFTLPFEAEEKGLFRIIVLDEVDRITGKAQDDLRSLLEGQSAWAKKTVVIGTTNEPHKLSAPVLQRFRLMRFDPVPADIIAVRLAEVAAKEGCALSDAAVRDVADDSGGSLREGLGLLQERCEALAGEEMPVSALEMIEAERRRVTGAEEKERSLSAVKFPLQVPSAKVLETLLEIVRDRAGLKATERPERYAYRGALYTEEAFIGFLREAAGRKQDLAAIVEQTTVRMKDVPKVTLEAFAPAEPGPAFDTVEALIAHQAEAGWELVDRQASFIRFYRRRTEAPPRWDRQEAIFREGRWQLEPEEVGAYLKAPDTAKPLPPLPAPAVVTPLPETFEDLQGDLIEQLEAKMNEARDAGVSDEARFAASDQYLKEQSRIRDSLARREIDERTARAQLTAAFDSARGALDLAIRAPAPPPPAPPAPPTPPPPDFVAIERMRERAASVGAGVDRLGWEAIAAGVPRGQVEALQRQAAAASTEAEKKLARREVGLEDAVDEAEAAFEWAADRIRALIQERAAPVPPTPAEYPALPELRPPAPPVAPPPPEVAPPLPPTPPPVPAPVMPGPGELAAFGAEVASAGTAELREAWRTKEWFGEAMGPVQAELVEAELRKRDQVQQVPAYRPPPEVPPPAKPPEVSVEQYEAARQLARRLPQDVIQTLLREGKWFGRTLSDWGRQLLEQEVGREQPAKHEPIPAAGPGETVSRDQYKRAIQSYSREMLQEMLADHGLLQWQREVASEVLKERKEGFEVPHGEDYARIRAIIMQTENLDELDAQLMETGRADLKLTKQDRLELDTLIEDRIRKRRDKIAAERLKLRKAEVPAKEVARRTAVERETPVETAMGPGETTTGACPNCGSTWVTFDETTTWHLGRILGLPPDYFYECPVCQRVKYGQPLSEYLRLQEANRAAFAPQVRAYLGKLAGKLEAESRRRAAPVLDAAMVGQIARWMWSNFPREVVEFGAVETFAAHRVEVARRWGQKVADSTSAPVQVATGLYVLVEMALPYRPEELKALPAAQRVWKSTAGKDIVRYGVDAAMQQHRMFVENLYGRLPSNQQIIDDLVSLGPRVLPPPPR